MVERKSVLITGANAGIGLATARQLALRNYDIIAICRDGAKGEETVATLRKLNPTINVDCFTADLSDLALVRHTTDVIAEKYPIIDRIINNAGYYPASIEYHDSIEKTLLASHLGHMLLVHRLLPSLTRSSEARIINVSSELHKQGSTDRFFKIIKDITPLQAYADAKLANILFTLGLTKHLPSQVTTFSLHPGVVRTNFAKNGSGLFSIVIKVFRPFFISPEQGAETSVYLADTEIKNIRNLNGAYFASKRLKPVTHGEVIVQKADWLWNKSIEVLQPYL